MPIWRTVGVVLSVAWMQCAPAQQKDLTSTEEAARPQFAVAIEVGRLTASFQNRSLQSISEHLATSMRVGVILAEGLSDDLISADLNGVAIEEGLPMTVWIYRKGTAGGFRPVAPAVWAVVKELEAGLSDADSRVRESVYEAPLERPDERSRRLVIDALTGARELDSALRETTAVECAQQRLFRSRRSSWGLARTDRSEQIRWIAPDSPSSIRRQSRWRKQQ